MVERHFLHDKIEGVNEAGKMSARYLCKIDGVIPFKN
jgi:hypothetical protein